MEAQKKDFAFTANDAKSLDVSSNTNTSNEDLIFYNIQQNKILKNDKTKNIISSLKYFILGNINIGEFSSPYKQIEFESMLKSNIKPFLDYLVN